MVFHSLTHISLWTSLYGHSRGTRYDWNVEENYFGLSRANRGNLVGSLSHGLLSTLAAMEDNAIQLANVSSHAICPQSSAKTALVTRFL